MMILVNFRRKKVVCLNRAACGQASKELVVLISVPCSSARCLHLTKSQALMVAYLNHSEHGSLLSKSLFFSFLKVNLPPCFFPSQDFTLFSRSCFPFPTPQCRVWPEH